MPMMWMRYTLLNPDEKYGKLGIETLHVGHPRSESKLSGFSTIVRIFINIFWFPHDDSQMILGNPKEMFVLSPSLVPAKHCRYLTGKLLLQCLAAMSCLLKHLRKMKPSEYEGYKRY